MASLCQDLVVSVEQIELLDNAKGSEVVVLTNIILKVDVLIVLDYDVKVQRFIYLVIGNDLDSPLLFFGVNFLIC